MLSDTLASGLESYRIGQKIRALRLNKTLGLSIFLTTATVGFSLCSTKKCSRPTPNTRNLQQRRHSPTWRYLACKRWLPSAIIEAASAAGVLREGPGGSAWFAHLDGHGVVSHVDVRGPTYKGSLRGGAKSLFRLPPKGPPFPRLVLAEAAIDALSVAAVESLRKDTLYIATGGGIGPGTIAALEALLASIALLPGALLCSAADDNGPGDRFADRHRSLGEKFRIPFARLRPPIEGGDWNDVLRARSETRGAKP